ncbi:hypothetical protein BTVI_55983 [Pitangus sulphuratus]|nr:hypothetical protein BTVI_55983 [Pitangus sulphuratus]
MEYRIAGAVGRWIAGLGSCLTETLNTPLKTVPSCPVAGCLGEEIDPHLATTSFQVVVESDEISPEPPVLQAKQQIAQGGCAVSPSGDIQELSGYNPVPYAAGDPP